MVAAKKETFLLCDNIDDEGTLRTMVIGALECN